MIKPAVSIGLAVYNGEDYLEEALTSLLAQTFSNFELIISDNASTDRTQDICGAYSSRDERIQYFRNDRNHGAAWNLNRLVELSNAAYFKWAAHDDVCAPQFVERCVEALDRNPSVVLCSTDTIIIDEHGTHVRKYQDACDASSPKPNERFRNLLHNLGLSNCMYGVARTNVLRKTRLIGSYAGSDSVLLGELALLGSFQRIPEYLFYRRDHSLRASRKSTSIEELAVWYDPKNKGTLQLLKWRLFKEHLRGIWHVPDVSFDQKARCYKHMAQSLKWRRHEILQEWARALSMYARAPNTRTADDPRPQPEGSTHVNNKR